MIVIILNMDGEWTIHNDRLTDAITKNSTRKVKKFCKKGANFLNTVHPLTGESPLYIAVRWKRHKSLELLLKNGAQPNVCRPKFQDTPLHLAAMEGDNKSVQLLLEHGADRFLRNHNYHTPIDLALDQRQNKTIELLIVPPHTPAPPTSQDSSLSTITVAWLPPQSKGSTISSYTLRIYEDATSMTTLNVPPVRVQTIVTCPNIKENNSSVVVDHCVPGVTYHVSIQACNDAGWSSESKRTPMCARPTPPDPPSTPLVIETTSTTLSIDWKNNSMNGYDINCYEVSKESTLLLLLLLLLLHPSSFPYQNFVIDLCLTALVLFLLSFCLSQVSYRVVRPMFTTTTRRKLTPDEAHDQSIYDSIEAAKMELVEAKRQEKMWLALFAPLDGELMAQSKTILEDDKELEKMKRSHVKCLEKIEARKGKKKKKNSSKKNSKEEVVVVEKEEEEEEEEEEEDEEDEEDDEEEETARALKQAREVLAEKIKSIDVARSTIYKNNVLVSTWKHEQELRFAVEQVKQFKENLKIWGKEQAEEAKKRAFLKVKTLQWNMDNLESRLIIQKKENLERREDLRQQRSEEQEKHTRKIKKIMERIAALKNQYWKFIKIGGTKIQNHLLRVQHGMTNSSGNGGAIPTGCVLTPLSPSTQFVVRCRCRNAVGWSEWSSDTDPMNPNARTFDAPFSVGHRIAADRILLSWETSLTIPLPLPLWSDVRLEFQDRTSYAKRPHEWVERLTWVDPTAELKRIKETGGFNKKKKGAKPIDAEHPLNDKTTWDLPLIEIGLLLAGHSYRFRLVERGGSEAKILGGGPSNWIRTASDVPGSPRHVTALEEKATSVCVSFSPPHLGPVDMYEIEYMLGVEMRDMREDTSSVDTTKRLRNLQDKIRPSGPWECGGVVAEETRIDGNDGNDGVEENPSTKTTAEESLHPSTVHKHIVKGLSPNSFYSIRVSASNANGIGPAMSTIHWIRTLPLPPTPSSLPPFVTGKSSRSLNVGWEPANGFGEIVLSYQVEMRERANKLHDEESSDEEEDEREEDDDGVVALKEEEEQEKENGLKEDVILTNRRRGAWQKMGQVAKSSEEDDNWRSLEVLELTPGRTYEFRLLAKSIFGWGAPGAVSRSVQCMYEPPEVVTTLEVALNRSGSMVEMKWLAPNSWQLAVEDYEIEIQSKQNLLMWTNVCHTSHNTWYVGKDVMKLGIPHRFRMRSASRVGYSKWSKDSKWLTLSDLDME